MNMGILDPIERKISKDRTCIVGLDDEVIKIRIIDDAEFYNIFYKDYYIDKTKIANFSDIFNYIIYDLADCEELTDEDKEAIEDAFNEVGNQYIEKLAALIEVGDTYCDPQGEYEIIATDREHVTLKCIDEAGPGLNIGKEYPGIPTSEAVFYIYGYYKDNSGIKYIPEEARL
jgi:hypothetical protein